LPAYRLPSPYDRTPLQRRATGLLAALAVNVGLLLTLMTLGIIPTPGVKTSSVISVDMIPAQQKGERTHQQTLRAIPERAESRPVPKPPPIVLPVKPTIQPPPAPPKEKTSPWIEMTHDQMAAADVSNLPQASGGAAGDSEVVGTGPRGEVLYAAEWAREPSSAEIGGYWPRNAPSGWGLVACKTIPNNRVEDCIELDQSPRGSHFASAVRQMAWQFHVRPPRKNGHPMIGAWVRIMIEIDSDSGGGDGAQ
jgi:protein TonB